MAEKLQPNGVAVSPEGQHRIATEHAELMLQGVTKIRWQHVDLALGQRLMEEMAEGVRTAAQILRHRHAQEEAGRCAAPGCKTRFKSTPQGEQPRVVGTIVMNDPRTGLPRSYQACSRACYAEIEKIERESRIARFTGR